MKTNNHKKLTTLAYEWFEKGKHDLDVAKNELENQGWTDVICFHCQQAVEKYLKGFLVANGIDVSKIKKWHIHDLPLLLRECQKLNPQLEKFQDYCEIITTYYIEARYPMDPTIEYSREETKQAIGWTQEIIEEIEGLIKPLAK